MCPCPSGSEPSVPGPCCPPGPSVWGGCVGSWGAVPVGLGGVGCAAVCSAWAGPCSLAGYWGCHGEAVGSRHSRGHFLGLCCPQRPQHTGVRSCMCRRSQVGLVWGQRCRVRGKDAGAAGPGAASSLCPGFPRREQKRRGLETCLGTVSSGALGASGEPTKAGGKSTEPRELRRRGQGCGMGRELPKAPLGCTPQGARGHSCSPHTDMETRPRAVPAAGELRGPGPGPGTGQGGGGEGTGQRPPQGRSVRRPRGQGQHPAGHPGALPLSRAARRGPHGSRGRDRAAAGGAAGAARAPRQTHPEDGGHRLLLRGPRGGRMVQGAGPARPGGHEGCGCEEDGPGPGRVCTVLPRLLPRHHGGRERSVCGGKLVQDPAGLRGRPAHQLLYLATGAGCQLLLRPSEPQAGSCPVRGHRLELLPVLEGKPAVRGGSRGCPRSPCAA